MLVDELYVNYLVRMCGNMHDVFYFTDVHGQLDLFQTMRDWCYKQDPECMIIYGGDACDRGEFGFDIMEMILDDPQIVYIRGNHEDMFIKATKEILSEHPEIADKVLSIKEAEAIIADCGWLRRTQLCLYNGGHPTLKNWMLDGTSTKFVDQLEERTVLTFTLDNGVCFSHAGGTYECWNRVNSAEYDNTYIDPNDAEDVIWDRDYLGAWWPKNKIIVFGHTPTTFIHDYVWSTPRMEENDMKPIAYKPTDKEENGWHIAMDTGMTWTGRGYVLNCLTMQLYGFLDPDVNKIDSKRPVEQFENYKII